MASRKYILSENEIAGSIFAKNTFINGSGSETGGNDDWVVVGRNGGCGVLDGWGCGIAGGGGSISGNTRVTVGWGSGGIAVASVPGISIGLGVGFGVSGSLDHSVVSPRGGPSVHSGNQASLDIILIYQIFREY